jgi:SecY interacting protein Syd
VTLADALTEFMDHTLKAYPDLQAPFDPERRSPCEIGEPFETDQGTLIAWRPMRRHPDSVTEDFAPVERALEISIHPDIKAYYGAYWSAGLEAEAVDGHVSLLFAWNPEDMERLNENLIGHALSKKVAKGRPMSVFFACTEPDSELFLSVDNDSGVVLLEKPGYRPIREVAPDLASFLTTLVPAPPELHP